MNNSTDGAAIAPATLQPERRGRSSSSPITMRFPEIRGGQCEFCGTIDPLQPATEQYKLCPHFRGMGELYCSYCPETKNPEEVTRISRINVAKHPTENSLVVWCNSTECSGKHIARFTPNN